MLSTGYMGIWVEGRVVLEHRLVMEQMIGRPLVGDENVHHVNGDRADNRPSNLELWGTAQPPGQRVEDKVAFAVEILQRYSPHLLASSIEQGYPEAITN